MSATSPPAADPAAVGLATPVAQVVAQDLEAILLRNGAQAPSRRRLRLGASAPMADRGVHRPERRAAKLGAMIAVAFVGVAAGAMIPRWHAKPAPASPPSVAPVLAAPAFSPPGLAPARVVTPAAAVEPKVEPARSPKARPDRRAPSRRASAATPCGADGRCGHADVMAADRRLRRAYAAAVRAGVSNAVLDDYRDRWSSLRRRAPEEPRRVTVGYRRLATELESEAARPRRTVYRAPPDDGWRRLRHEIAALWP